MRAKVEIFDEHTGRVICEENFFPPYKEEYDPITQTWQYEFRVKAVVIISFHERLLDMECELVRSIKEATDEEIKEVLKGGIDETSGKTS